MGRTAARYTKYYTDFSLDKENQDRHNAMRVLAGEGTASSKRKVQKIADAYNVSLEHAAEILVDMPDSIFESIVTDSMSQNVHEKYAFQELAAMQSAGVFGYVEQPRSAGPRSMHLVNRDGVPYLVSSVNLTKSDRKSLLAKSVDFIAVRGTTLFAMAHKHTSTTGGGQKNQALELEKLCAQVSSKVRWDIEPGRVPTAFTKICVVAIADGAYYTRSRRIAQTEPPSTWLSDVADVCRKQRTTGALVYAVQLCNLPRLVERVVPGEPLPNLSHFSQVRLRARRSAWAELAPEPITPAAYTCSCGTSIGPAIYYTSDCRFCPTCAQPVGTLPSPRQFSATSNAVSLVNERTDIAGEVHLRVRECLHAMAEAQ